jgi:hypothetical protein
MLREMDFIKSDSAAFSWALGSAAAILRYSIPRGAAVWMEKHCYLWKGVRLRTVGIKAAGLAAGVVFSIGVLAACVFGLTRGLPYLFPEWHLAQMKWAQWLGVLGMPEAVFVTAAFVFWRKRRIVSTGILLSAITLVMHFILYVSTHA